MLFFFFKQKTAYEMRISDWSSDVCSSDLLAPDFEQDSTHGRIRFHSWLGDSWGVLFSHPRNFTPVCTTELGEVARLRPEWDRRNVKVIGLSVDPVEAHRKWEDDITETQDRKSTRLNSSH